MYYLKIDLQVIVSLLFFIYFYLIQDNGIFHTIFKDYTLIKKERVIIWNIIKEKFPKPE